MAQGAHSNPEEKHRWIGWRWLTVSMNYCDDILGQPMGTPKTPYDLSNNHTALLVRVWCASSDILYHFIAFDPRTKRLVQDLQTKVGKLISPTMTVQTAMNRWILQCNHQLWRAFFRFFFRIFLFLEIQGLWFQPFNLQGCTDKPLHVWCYLEPFLALAAICLNDLLINSMLVPLHVYIHLPTFHVLEIAISQ